MSYPITLVKLITPIALAVSLVACGGDTNFGNKSGTTTTDDETVVGSIQFSTSATELPSDGLLPVILKAVAKDTDNNVITDANIKFSVIGDAEATIIQTGSGVTTVAELTPGLPINRTLTVKATSGTYSKNLNVSVVGTNIVIDGPEAIGFGTEADFLLKLKNSSNKAIAGAEVSIESSNSNVISFASNFTDSNGEIAFSLGSVNSGTDNITATANGATFSKSINISADDFVLNGSSQDIVINTNEVINFVWKKNGVPQVGKTIVVVATRGMVSSPAPTNSAGETSFTINSAQAGQVVITATNTASGLSTSMNREFVATNAYYLNTQVTPAFIFPNGSSVVLAKVSDIDENPVKGKTVEFSLDRDTVNGNLSSATAVTDSLGRASVSYTAGDVSSGEAGVIIRSKVRGTDIDPEIVTLTVGGEATRISLGSDNLVGKVETNYEKQFGVLVTDTGGSPVKGQKVSFTLKPTHYYQGCMVIGGTTWGRYMTGESHISEDLNNNGFLDEGEDTNGDGYLQPTHDAGVVVAGEGTTDDEGILYIKIVFAKNTAVWSRQLLTASINSNGTEFVESTSFDLPMAASDASSITSSPPNLFSPYGHVYGSLCDILYNPDHPDFNPGFLDNN